MTRIADRLLAAWRTRRPDPARASLGVWLVVLHVAVVVAVVAGIAVTAGRMLREQADEQGRARVQLASATAREELRRIAEDDVVAMRALAERPALDRLLAEGRTDALPSFLRRACEAAGLDACAIVSGTQVITTSGPAVEWNAVLAAGVEQGASFFALPTGFRAPVLAAFASVGDLEGTRVYSLRLLNERLARELSRRAGLEIQLVDYRSYTNGPITAYAQLHAAALADGRSATQRVDAQHRYAASTPLFASTGETVALIEALLPTEAIDVSSQKLNDRLRLTALVLAALAVLAGILLSRMVTAPVKALTDAAVRLGQGDFSTSIPVGGAAEVGALARTMEDMRRSLVDLTGALRRSEGEAQAVLRGIVEGVYAVDRARIIRYLNPQAAKLLGLEPAQAIGRFCGDVLKPCLEGGQRPCETQCPILLAREDGSARAVERLQLSDADARTAVITSSGMVEGMQVQVIRDETELEAVRRARDSVLANISHEFRTPLAAQLASIELLIDGLPTMTSAQQLDLVRSLERGALRLTRLIDNLLESARIESGQLSIRRQQVALSEIVDNAQALIGSLLALRRQRLVVSLPPDLPTIEGDMHRLTQVFVNLLANANKYAPEGSTVRIGAEARAGNVVAWVEDEGSGPSAADGEAMFGRFRRGAGEEPSPGGLGLGLWIVKSIVDRHEGTIEMVRTEAGTTRFVVTLPAEAGP